jgi:enediyne biosynthesis protein E4
MLCTACAVSTAKPALAQTPNKSTATLAPVFEKIPVEQSGLSRLPNQFGNDFDSTMLDTINTIVPGAGVGVGDIDNDGFEDIILADFAGVSLFRNCAQQGKLCFTNESWRLHQPPTNQGMCTGVLVADITGDGYADVLVTRFQRPSLFFVNNKHGEFIECAQERGLGVVVEAVHSSVLDYNRDGRQDIYLVVYSNISEVRGKEITDKNAIALRHIGATDILFAQMPDGTFVDVSKEAGIKDAGMGLSATVADIDGNGWPDIYVANDFNAADILYMNYEGKFVHAENTVLRKTPLSSMGSDIADLNSDGLFDILSTDMLPYDHYRRIRNAGFSGDYSIYNPQYDSNQVARNVIHLNNGSTFSDVAYMIGLADTDWSWSILAHDFSLDGKADVHVTNGYFMDITNQDYVYNLQSKSINPWVGPYLRLPNVFAQQTASLEFVRTAEVSQDSTASFGAAFGDFDKDGDDDLVVMNLDSQPSLLKNLSCDNGKKSVTINLVQLIDSVETPVVGATAIVWRKNQKTAYHTYPVRGFQSTVSTTLNVAWPVDSVHVRWPNGAFSTHSVGTAKQSYRFRQPPSIRPETITRQPDALLRREESRRGLTFAHKEDKFDDFKRYRMMPTRASWMGPCVVKGDVNKDGELDILFGGARNQPNEMFIQNRGMFQKVAVAVMDADSSMETQGMCIADLNNDGLMDIVVAGGGIEFAEDDDERCVMAYLQTDAGWKKHTGIPKNRTNATCVLAADINNDGWVDIIVGGGIATNAYPTPDSSYVFINRNGTFTNETAAIAPDIQSVGMVRSIAYSNVIGDSTPELIVVGEWTNINVLQQTHGVYRRQRIYGLDTLHGWWYKVLPADVNSDGKMDLLLGNIGRNSRYQPKPKEPIELWYADYDDNGSIDALVTYWQNGKRFLVRDRPKIFSQMPTLNRRFNRFEDFAKAPFQDILTAQQHEKSQRLYATEMRSGVCINNGNSFSFVPFPAIVQSAPVIGMDTLGSAQTVVAVGNMYGAEDDIIRYDAGRGYVLVWNEATTSFEVREQLGIVNDMRNVCVVPTASGEESLVVVANHSSASTVFVHERRKEVQKTRSKR